jgi:ribosome maturation factor RimP
MAAADRERVDENVDPRSARVESVIAPAVEDMGYEIVRVIFSGKQKPVLQVMAERVDRGAMTVDDCAAISRTVSALLDVEDPVPGAYTLEVSSPGIDRPLTRRRDFDRFAGFEARLETHEPVGGRKRFRGRLLGTAAEAVRLTPADGPEGREIALPFAAIKKAKLVLTDDLIASGHGA